MRKAKTCNEADVQWNKTCIFYWNNNVYFIGKNLTVKNISYAMCFEVKISQNDQNIYSLGLPYKSVLRTRSELKKEYARTSSSCWTKLCTKIIYTLLQAFVLLLQISYQKKSFLTTPNIENQSRSSAEFH